MCGAGGCWDAACGRERPQWAMELLQGCGETRRSKSKPTDTHTHTHTHTHKHTLHHEGTKGYIHKERQTNWPRDPSGTESVIKLYIFPSKLNFPHIPPV